MPGVHHRLHQDDHITPSVCWFQQCAVDVINPPPPPLKGCWFLIIPSSITLVDATQTVVSCPFLLLRHTKPADARSAEIPPTRRRHPGSWWRPQPRQRPRPSAAAALARLNTHLSGRRARNDPPHPAQPSGEETQAEEATSGCEGKHGVLFLQRNYSKVPGTIYQKHHTTEGGGSFPICAFTSSRCFSLPLLVSVTARAPAERPHSLASAARRHTKCAKVPLTQSVISKLNLSR